METVGIRMPAELKEAIDQTARQYQLDRPAFVRAILALACSGDLKLSLVVKAEDKRQGRPKSK